MITEILYQFAQRISKETRQTVIYDECTKEAVILHKIMHALSAKLVASVFDANIETIKDLKKTVLDDLSKD